MTRRGAGKEALVEVEVEVVVLHTSPRGADK